VHGDQEVVPDELVQLEIVHVARSADLRCVHDDEHVVRIDMDSRYVATVLTFADRYGMKAEITRQQCLGLVAPFRDVEPEESVCTLPQRGQLGGLVVAHASGVDPAQLHSESPFHIFSTPRH
jgi:hypothetical protein